MEDAEKLKYPGMRADISRCNALLHELCQIVWDRNYKAEQVVFSIPPVPRNFDMQFSAAFDELSAYRATGDVEELTALAKARDEGRVVVLPCKRGDKVWRICGPKGRKFVAERQVLSVTMYSPGSFSVFTNCSDWLGKTVFLTRAEAEAALKGASDG